jgi:Flp pilus assembly protein TadD
MEFVEGESLATVLKRRGKIAPVGAAAIMHQVIEGLAAAHDCHVIHRDLKPANIMCDSDGRIVIMDFGLARHEAPDGLTRTGAVLGTLDYMSPEQAQGRPVDARCDLFTAGMIFYELLTGRRPYQADSAIASLVKRSHERAQPASSCDSSIPTALSRICSKCLEGNPEDRYQSATELLADLEAWMTDSQLFGGRSGWAWAERAPAGRRMPWRATALTAMVIAVAAVAGIFVLRHRPTSTAAHAPVSVLVADFTNHTGEPVFDDTLEPAFNVAMEGASFINAFNRGTARKLARKLPNPSDKLDEQPARLVAVSEGVSAVITGDLEKRGGNYRISATALDAVSGKVLSKAEVTAADKDEVLRAIPKLAAPIRKALGDTTPESVQVQNAGGAFTAASLEAVHQYGIAMEQQFAGKMQDALGSFSNAVQLDPNFARAYSGMAVAYRNLGQQEDAKKYIKMAMAHVDRLTERERYRLRGTYYSLDENWQKCIEEYSELVSRYPADNIGHNNLAYCFSHVRNLAKAVDEAQRAVENQPSSAGWRVNLSLFSSYAGDFQKGEGEARKVQQLNPAFEYGYLALAFSQVGQGQLSQAAETYHKLEKVSPLGASWGAAGLADVALYEGRFSEAARILEHGAEEDRTAKNLDAAADKFATLAYIQLWMQHRQLAIAAADKVLANSQSVRVRFLTAQVFAEAGEATKARKVAATLASELSAEPQAYAKVIEGESALKAGDTRQAVKALTEANNLLDTWIGRFELGRAYLEAGAFAEADSEFDRCIKRRGETLALFLDEVPTYGYLPPVYYYQGRVREGLKSAGFAEPYRTYLSIRGQAGEDPLLPEVRRRAGP